MNTQNKHIHISENEFLRLIVISDIHAHNLALKKMLDLIQLSPRDLLVINGDFLNRGDNSTAVMTMIMALSKQDNVRILAGNHEVFMLDFVRRKKFKKRIRRLIDTAKYPTMIYEMYHRLKEQGVDLFVDPIKLSKQLKKAYKTEFEFLNNLPIILETERFIFVHSAYEEDYNLDDNFYDYIKNDDYAKNTGYHHKTIVIGHIPVNNIAGTTNHHAPHYLKEKNVYMIDGGLGVIDDGVLNALIIDVSEKKIKFNYLQTY